MEKGLLNQVADRSLFGGQAGQSLATVLNQIFYVGLVAAVALALFMVVRGGVQYMTTDSIDGKGGAKARIQAALGGLVLAFSAILILSTINPSLVTLSLKFDPVQVVQSTGPGLDVVPNEIASQITGAVNQYQGITQEVIDEMLRTGKIPDGLSPASQKILAEALNAVGNLKTGYIEGTNGGNYACAAAVNKIIEQALGQPINGSLSTVDMYKSLQSSSNFVLVGSDYSQAMPGDIIISPTEFDSNGTRRTGHVGIVATPGATSIISNSSSAAVVKANFTADSWESRYEDNKNLGVYIYRPR